MITNFLNVRFASKIIIYLLEVVVRMDFIIIKILVNK